jgi:hypothetical protein
MTRKKIHYDDIARATQQCVRRKAHVNLEELGVPLTCPASVVSELSGRKSLSASERSKLFSSTVTAASSGATQAIHHQAITAIIEFIARKAGETGLLYRQSAREQGYFASG